jgi:hypothetical protein
MTTCRLNKCGFSPPVIMAGGYLKELVQVFDAMVEGEGYGAASESAWADADFRDNKHGATCPSTMKCERRCKGWEGQDKGPEDFGPFWGGKR